MAGRGWERYSRAEYMSQIRLSLLIVTILFCKSSFSQDVIVELVPIDGDKTLIVLANVSDDVVKVHEVIGLNECFIKSAICLEFQDPSQVKISALGDSLVGTKALEPREVTGRVMRNNMLFRHIKLLTDKTIFRIVYYLPDSSPVVSKWMVLTNDFRVEQVKE